MLLQRVKSTKIIDITIKITISIIIIITSTFVVIIAVKMYDIVHDNDTNAEI